jgi:hypothetical protein
MGFGFGLGFGAGVGTGAGSGTGSEEGSGSDTIVVGNWSFAAIAGSTRPATPSAQAKPSTAVAAQTHVVKTYARTSPAANQRRISGTELRPSPQRDPEGRDCSRGLSYFQQGSFGVAT